MEKALLDFMTGKTRELIATPTCCAELKAVAEEWLAAPDADVTRRYVAEMEADIVTAEGLLAFAGSEAGAKVFGAKAPEVAAHAQGLVDSGAPWCDCPACAACAAMLEKKDQLLK